jgi:hypothetical protein
LNAPLKDVTKTGGIINDWDTSTLKYTADTDNKYHRNDTEILLEPSKEFFFVLFFGFVEWGDTESTRYVGH